MAESSVQVAEHKTALREFSSELSNGSSSLFQRRIEFHPARRPYKGFGKNGCGGGGGGDFRIETLNPSASSDPVRTGFGSGQPKKSDASEVSDGGLDLELSFGITFRTIVSCSAM